MRNRWNCGPRGASPCLWQAAGKTAEARELLAPVYDWFTDWFETADLKEAKGLLEELS